MEEVVVLLGDLGDFVVGHELPDPVRSKQHYLVVFSESILGHDGRADDAYLVRHFVADGSGHGQPRARFIREPDAERADLLAHVVADG